jgi:hypothetical protein
MSWDQKQQTRLFVPLLAVLAINGVGRGCRCDCCSGAYVQGARGDHQGASEVHPGHAGRMPMAEDPCFHP